MVSPCTNIQEFITEAKQLTTDRTAVWQGKKVSKAGFEINKDNIIQFLSQNKSFWLDSKNSTVKRCINNLAKRIKQEFPDEKMQLLANALIIKTQRSMPPAQSKEQPTQGENTGTAEVLPPDILTKILGMASPDSLEEAKQNWLTMGVVSKKWKTATLQTQVNFIGKNQVPIHQLGFETQDEALNYLQKCGTCSITLRYLDLSKYSVNVDELLKNGTFDNLQSLQGLVLENSQISNETLKQICLKCPQLEKLVLTHCTGFTQIPELPSKLKELDIEFDVKFARNQSWGAPEPINPTPLACPPLPEGLEKLSIKGCSLDKLPELPKNVKEINIESFTLKELPQLPPNLIHLSVNLRNGEVKVAGKLPETLRSINLNYPNARTIHSDDGRLTLKWNNGSSWVVPQNCQVVMAA